MALGRFWNSKLETILLAKHPPLCNLPAVASWVDIPTNYRFIDKRMLFNARFVYLFLDVYIDAFESLTCLKPSLSLPFIKRGKNKAVSPNTRLIYTQSPAKGIWEPLDTTSPPFYEYSIFSLSNFLQRRWEKVQQVSLPRHIVDIYLNSL